MEASLPSRREDKLAFVMRSAGTFLAHRESALLSRGYVRILTHALPGRELQITDLSGHRQVVDTRDQMGANALVGRYRLPAAVIACVEPGDWVIDCGANIGIVTSQLCAAVGPSGAVWACEPIAANVARLDFLKSANQLDQLTIVSSAIGAEPGTAMIGIPPRGRSGWASITKSFGMEERVPVEVETLDLLAVRQAPDRRLRMLKIDVEGFEFEVLDGARELLSNHRPLVYCEFNDILLRDRGRSSSELTPIC